MPESGQLSVNDRVLLHLSRFASDLPPEEYPPETAQTGIASAVGISRTHVPRAVKGLIKDRLVIELTARVRGHERRMNVYTVSTEGLRKAEELWRAALESPFAVMTNGRTVEMRGKEIEGLVGRKRALAVISQMRDGVVAIDETRRPPFRDLKDAPSVREFYGRDSELDSMEAFMESESKVLVVMGNRGYGTSSLTRKFVDEQDDTDVLWTNLSPNTSASDLKERITSFGRKLNGEIKDLEHVIKQKNALLVFDDYFSVGEDVVEFFESLVEIPGDTKIVIAAREDTPAYNWFYHKQQVEAKLVRELRIRGLDESSSRRLLGNEDIEKDAFRRIMMMSRGQPMALRMLRERDLTGLKSNTMFTPEEVRYMLFLRDKTA